MNDRYCPFCTSMKPMRKAGKAYRIEKDKQRWECRNCRRMTVKPLIAKGGK